MLWLVKLASGPAGDHGTTAIMTGPFCHGQRRTPRSGSLCVEHGPGVLRFVYHLTEGDRHHAARTWSGNLLRGLSTADELDISNTKPAWLITVARHLDLLDAQRARQTPPGEGSRLDTQLALAAASSRSQPRRGLASDTAIDLCPVRSARYDRNLYRERSWLKRARLMRIYRRHVRIRAHSNGFERVCARPAA